MKEKLNIYTHLNPGDTLIVFNNSTFREFRKGNLKKTTLGIVVKSCCVNDYYNYDFYYEKVLLTEKKYILHKPKSSAIDVYVSNKEREKEALYFL